MTFDEYRRTETDLADAFAAAVRAFQVATAPEEKLLSAEEIDDLLLNLDPVLSDLEAAAALATLEAEAGIVWGAPLAAPEEER